MNKSLVEIKLELIHSALAIVSEKHNKDNEEKINNWYNECEIVREKLYENFEEDKTYTKFPSYPKLTAATAADIIKVANELYEFVKN